MRRLAVAVVVVLALGSCRPLLRTPLTFDPYKAETHSEIEAVVGDGNWTSVAAGERVPFDGVLVTPEAWQRLLDDKADDVRAYNDAVGQLLDDRRLCEADSEKKAGEIKLRGRERDEARALLGLCAAGHVAKDGALIGAGASR